MKRKKRVRRSNKLFTVSVAAISLALFISLMAIVNHSKTVDSKEFQMYLNVDDYIGFNVDTEALFFGTVLAGGESSRSVNLENNFDVPLKVVIKAMGTLADWTSVSNNSFWMAANYTESVKVTIKVPEDANK